MSSSSKGQKVQLDDVRRLDESLAQLPEPQNQMIAKTEAIRILLPRIQSLQARGYSLADIAERLSNGGVPMTPMMLRVYLMREGGSQKSRRNKSRKRIAPAENTGVSASTSQRTTRGITTNSADPGTMVLGDTAKVAPKTSENGRATTVDLPATAKATSSSGPPSQPGTRNVPDAKKTPGSFVPRKDSDEI